MAKSLDNRGAEKPEETPENKAGPSKLIMEALGSHAETAALVQGDGEEEIHFAVRCIEALGGIVIGQDESIKQLETEKAVLETELKALNRRLASQRGATTKARSRIVELEEAGKPRKLGPMTVAAIEAAEAFNAFDIAVAIDDADQIVLAFSDGANELRGIKPRQVRAEAFQMRRGRLHFTDEPLEVTGPGGADTSTWLAGVALLVDGEQVAWSAMAQPMSLGAGQTVNLAGSVIFG